MIKLTSKQREAMERINNKVKDFRLEFQEVQYSNYNPNNNNDSIDYSIGVIRDNKVDGYVMEISVNGDIVIIEEW